jgi:hypothetical protein
MRIDQAKATTQFDPQLKEEKFRNLGTDDQKIFVDVDCPRTSED